MLHTKYRVEVESERARVAAATKLILVTNAVHIALLSLRFEKHVVPCAQFYVAIFIIGDSVHFLIGSFEHLWGEFMFSFFVELAYLLFHPSPFCTKKIFPKLERT